MSSTSNTPPEGYFNDLSHPTGSTGRNKRSRSPVLDMNGTPDGASGGDLKVPKPKRIACIICRKRKLKCEGQKPSCSTCTRLGHNCAYDEIRKKSGPKRGYVKALEERLKQVETLLATHDPATGRENAPANFASAQNSDGIPVSVSIPNADFSVPNPSISLATAVNADRWGFNGESPQTTMDDLGFTNNMGMGIGIEDNTFTWEMIGLGLEEPLPPQDTIDELHQIYFDKIHPSLPMIHKFRYLAAMNLAPNQRPPVALRYAMWTLAASVVDKYMDLRDHFYQRSRKYIELDYLKGHGEHIISIAHAQTHILLASFEFKMMYFPRAWMSTGSGVRMCQMMGLHRLDGVGLDIKQALPPPRDWTEREERRRTFWMAFNEDRYASIGTGWPMTIDEKDILTDLPASEEAFEMSKAERTHSLADALSPSGASKLSTLAGVVLLACLFGRNLIHLHRPDVDDRDNDLNGEFWKRHRSMDNIILNTALSMPSHLKLPNGLSDPNVIFLNMNIQTSTICLHQAAIYKADENRLPSLVSAESKVRCITAANEIAKIMRMISHVDLATMNPFLSFCLYVAARVFVQFLKSRPDDGKTGDSLRFLLSAMNALKKKNPLTESFLVQLDVDLESLGVRNPEYKGAFASSKDNLGSSSAKIPAIGKNSRGGVWDNQCHFMPVREETNGMDESQVAPPDTSNEFGPGSDQPNWIPLEGHQNRSQEQEVQRTLAGLVVPVSNYGSGELNGGGGYVNSEGRNTSTDSGPSPDTIPSASRRPTPNSSTPSDTRSNHHTGQANNSVNHSYETSPEMPNEHGPLKNDCRPLSGFFPGNSDYSNIPSTGLTPDNTYVIPETPGRDFGVPSVWELSGQTTGLTNVGEGVFRHIMGLGSLDAMDIGWEGTSPE